MRSPDKILSIIEEDKNGKYLSAIHINFNQYENYSEVDIAINKRLNNEKIVTTLSIKINYCDFIDKIERIFSVDNHQNERNF